MLGAIFKLVWWHRWPHDWMDRPHTLVRVTGWRSGLFDSYSKQRERITFCFSIFGYEFD